MRSKIRTFLAALAMVFTIGTVTPTPVAESQVVLPSSFLEAEGVGVTLGAVSTDVGILIKYVGTSPAGGTVEVAAATGDITLKTGVVGTSVADTTVECPLSAPLAGVIDVSDGRCNTLGEVVDHINGSANWRAVIVDGLRSDSSDNTLITLAESSASLVKGKPLLKDTTVALNVTVALEPFDRLDIRNYFSASGTSVAFNSKPQGDHRGVLFFASGTFTGTGADTFEVISAAQNLQRCTLGAADTVCSASEDAATILSTPGGTTGVNKEYKNIVYGRLGDKFLVRLKAATTFTAAFLSANGVNYEFKR